MAQPQPLGAGQCGAGAWRPEPKVTHHSGHPLGPHDEFFCPPPTEIGRIVTAATTLTTDRHPKSIGLRLGVAVAILVVFIGLAELLIHAARIRDDGSGIWALRGLIAGLGALIGLIVFLASGFRTRCSYVGEQGLARFQISGSRSGVPRAYIMRFCDVDELYTARTRNYYNGVYTGTAYDYKWLAAGRSGPVFRLNGQYRSEQDTPKLDSPYWFADSAEVAWSEFRLAALAAEVEANGFAEFQIGRRRAVRFGPDYLEFITDGLIERMEASDVGHIGAANGTITFKHKDARWFSGKGKFSFQFSTIPNATLFLMCLDRLSGFKVG